jgi:transposase
MSVGMSRSDGWYLRRAGVVGKGMDDAALERRLFTQSSFEATPTRAQPDWNCVHKELKRRRVTLLLLWEEYRAEHADGYGTHAAGKKLFVDWAGDTVPLFDALTGEARRAHIFVAMLGAFNYTYAEARCSEALPEWIGAHVNALTDIGGVPAAVVCDHLKAGGLHSAISGNSSLTWPREVPRRNDLARS